MTKKPPILWLNLAIFISTFAVAVIGVPWYGLQHGFSTASMVIAAVFWLWSGMSITAGYHRLWSHKAWQAHPSVQWLLAIGGAMAMQNSILHWCADHRVHHKHVDDNDKDPYSAGRGFWFSHIGWMLRNYQPTPDYKNVRDLQKNAIVMNQHNHYGWWVLGTNIGAPLLLGALFGDALGTLLLAGFLRLVVVHHSTFFINSLAHIWGSQPYSDQHSSRDNGVIALLTYGEGYHNFHHTFEYDYRNGIRWWHFDPTKWLIRALEKCGLASSLRRVPAGRIEAARLSMQLKSSQRLLAEHQLAAEWLHKLELEYEQLLHKMQGYYDEKQRQLQLKRAELDRSARERLAELRDAFELQQRQWHALRAQAHAVLN
ncbi:acyl-CoA desaturase [Ferrimonas marina]|uniref:Stearoyl-CoA desaturase (Delta-9 desaturase) n=1 Tax=Ferrimonas marina TaxID=299255 RepID=A0A1M5Z8L7_9GAMM|nr:fatty acid desaturase [Ferrimonas marina]SHI20534.1 stearoyl-CoA desaturase (delta-9 desaturase) [Ferrimonas marina]